MFLTLSFVERNMPRGTPMTPDIIVTKPKMRATLKVGILKWLCRELELVFYDVYGCVDGIVKPKPIRTGTVYVKKYKIYLAT